MTALLSVESGVGMTYHFTCTPFLEGHMKTHVYTLAVSLGSCECRGMMRASSSTM